MNNYHLSDIIIISYVVIFVYISPQQALHFLKHNYYLQIKYSLH